MALRHRRYDLTFFIPIALKIYLGFDQALALIYGHFVRFFSIPTMLLPLLEFRSEKQKN